MTRLTNDTLIDMHGVAETTGYAYTTVETKVQRGNKDHDPLLYRLRISTDETYRKAFECPRTKYVYRYGDVKRWRDGRV